MKNNKLLRYFKNYTPLLVGGGAVAVTGFLLWYYSWELWRFGTPLMLIGAALIVIYFILRIDDRHYSEYIESKLEAMPREPDHTFDGYIFDGTHFAKLDKTGSPRSEIAVRTLVYLGKKLKIVSGTVNVEAGAFDVVTHELAQASAQVENVELRVKGTAKKAAVLKVTGDGVECTFPVKYNDIEVDRLCSQIVEKYK